MAWSFKKIALVAGGTVVGGAACFLTAGAAAPAIGAIIGSTTMGLSGAAATSAGLAALGGGAIASGGGGMAAGAALITTYMTGAGAVLGTLGMGTAANFFKTSNKEFEKALHVQKNYAKAQEIILKQESKIRDLQSTLDRQKQGADFNQKKINQLSEAIQNLTKVVNNQQDQLNKAQAA